VLLKQLMQQDGPAYLRIGKFGEPTYRAEAPAVLGQARLVRRGERVAILTTGDMAAVALQAVEQLQAAAITPWLYQFHTVKPLDTATLEALSKQVDTLVVVEDAIPAGGLGAAVASWLVSAAARPRLIRLGPPDEFVLGNPSRETMLQRYNYGCSAIVAACQQAVGSRTVA